MASSQSLTYTALDCKANSIRLLHLRPGSFNDPIDCLLTTTQLGHKPIFEALSYEWGTTESDAHVNLNGQKKRVTLNLFTALRYLRYRDMERVLWVDALCINQDDIQERNQQVSLMGQIYSAADSVAAWIGSVLPFENDVSETLFHNFVACTTDLEELDRNLLSLRPKRIRHRSYINMNPMPIEVFLEVMLHHIGERSYWLRTWIVQEVFLAKRLNIHYGDFIFNPAIFIKLWDAKWPHPNAYWMGKLENSPAVQILRSRRDYHQKAESKQPFVDLLSLTQNSLASDARDKVYAVLGLASDAFGLGDIPIDYSKPVLEVYRDVVKFHVKRNLIAQAAQCSQILQISVPTPIQPSFETRWPDGFHDWSIYEREDLHTGSSFSWKRYGIVPGWIDSEDCWHESIKPFGSDFLRPITSDDTIVLIRKIGCLEMRTFRMKPLTWGTFFKPLSKLDQAIVIPCEGWKVWSREQNVKEIIQAFWFVKRSFLRVY